MAEPLDPAALGVASALKSLRTRTGLREERLRGTELVLDTLTGLDSVRALVNAGQSPERAIVDAVRAAAGTLEPTMSIVADASLSLRLFADQVPDGELYAEDLGQRREALLRNWDRLHELRSVRSGKAPSPRALRLEVESEALTALAGALTARAPVPGAAGARGAERAGCPRTSVGSLRYQPGGAAGFRRGAHPNTLRTRDKTIEQAAARLGVPPAKVARWAAGEELPSAPQARSLDKYLDGPGRHPEPRRRVALPAGAPRPPARPGAGAQPVSADPAADVPERRAGAARTASPGTPTAGPRGGRPTCAYCRVRRRRHRPPTGSRRCCCWRTAWRPIWFRSRKASARWRVRKSGFAGHEQSDRARNQPRRC